MYDVACRRSAAGELPQLGSLRRSMRSITRCAACPTTRSAITSAGAASTRRTRPTSRFEDIVDLVLSVTRRRLFDRDGEPASRARVAGVGARKLPTGTQAHPRRHRPRHQHRRASRTGVAERIVRLAQLVGRENVIAATDCGFAQVAVLHARPSVDHVGEARVAGTGRSARQQAALAAGESTAGRRPSARPRNARWRSARPDGARPGSDHSAVGLPAMNSLATSFAPCALRSRWPAPGNRTNCFGALIIA